LAELPRVKVGGLLAFGGFILWFFFICNFLNHFFQWFILYLNVLYEPKKTSKGNIICTPTVGYESKAQCFLIL